MEDLESMLIQLLIVFAVISIFFIIVYWRIYEKAGQPGWASLVPFYNTYVLIVYILKMPKPWFWLLIVPFLGILVAIPLIFMIPFKLAEKFGKGGGFGVGLLFLGIIFYPILAFGSAEYVGDGRSSRRGGYGGSREEDEEYDRRKW